MDTCIPIYAFDDSGNKRYLFDISNSTGLEGIKKIMGDCENEYPYKKFYCIYQGVELLVYEKSE